MNPTHIFRVESILYHWCNIAAWINEHHPSHQLYRRHLLPQHPLLRCLIIVDDRSCFPRIIPIPSHPHATPRWSGMAMHQMLSFFRHICNFITAHHLLITHHSSLIQAAVDHPIWIVYIQCFKQIPLAYQIPSFRYIFAITRITFLFFNTYAALCFACTSIFGYHAG